RLDVIQRNPITRYVFPLDTSILTPNKVFQASGHVKNFTDAWVDDRLSKARFRPDKARPVKLVESDDGMMLPIEAVDKPTAKEWEIAIKNMVPGVRITRSGKRIHLYVQDFQAGTPELPGQIVFRSHNNVNAIAFPYHGYVDPKSNSPFLTESRNYQL